MTQLQIVHADLAGGPVLPSDWVVVMLASLPKGSHHTARAAGAIMGLSIQECLIRIEKRAERAGDEKLTETFVDAAPLLASVSTTDHQVIFGRRGTGKTHILKYLSDDAERRGDYSLYIDLRSIGSNGSIYSDREKTHAQRATPLLLDVMQAIHEALFTIVIDSAEEFDLSRTGPLLDAFADAISEVEVVGTIESSSESTESENIKSGFRAGLSGNSTGLKIDASLSADQERISSIQGSIKRTGVENYYVKFGTVQSRLRAILSALGGKRLWLLLDEWSEIPLDIQPYLADLLRRCVIPVSGITLKIAAIEQRTQLIQRQHGGYLGIELGADAGGDVNLDDFMVFDNDAQRSLIFFADLLFRHYRATDGLDPAEGPQTSSEFIGQTFTQITAFEEFVRAVEGVPRDAVYLASTVARRAHERLIGVQDVRNAARDWYQRDKANVLKSEPELSRLLDWIIEEVIGHRRARAFLLVSHARHHLIDTLFDSRLLHILKKSISSHDNPGTRYDVYKLDYGCYVELITSSRSPSGLLPGSDEEDDNFVDVPPDDYRSIRRAILNLDEFDRKRAKE